MATDMVEREVKLRFESPEAARAAVLAAGAKPLRPRRLQEDALFDYSDETLRRRRCVVRIRTEAGESVLTFKGPAQGGPMKVREERETAVADGAVLRHVFEQLGLQPWFRYEKYREEFAADRVVVAIDETPVGTWVEIEGDEPGIRAMTAALGRSEQDFIVDSYRNLFLKHREACGLTGPHMLFAQP